MKAISRQLEAQLTKQLGRNKVILIMGTRRVGKTMLVRTVSAKYKQPQMMLNAEDIDVQDLLATRSAANYKRVVGDSKLLIIDEAQVLKDVGLILKLMIDTFQDLTIIATGSSSFDLANKTGEPLTGRQIVHQLHPISQAELSPLETVLDTKQRLEDRLIFGSYPEIFQLGSTSEKSNYLQQLVQSYLLKDILAFDGIRQSDKIIRLLRLVALQCGSEVSTNELATQLGMSKNTVDKYLDLLSKVFIIYKVGAYSRNPRKEISKSSKWYFYDNGIRNGILNDFSPLTLRKDIGMLWENYILSERIKFNSHKGRNVEYHFWRTYNQQEVDLIEIENGQLQAFEFKYAPSKKVKKPSSFATDYPDVDFQVITKDNYLDWIT